MATPTRVQAFGNTAATTPVTATATVTQGNVLYAVFASTVAVGVISDSKGNTWVQQATGISGSAFVYSAIVTNGGSTTVSVGNTGATNLVLSVIEVTGQLAAVDAKASAGASGTSASSGATPTPASSNELVLGFIVANANSAATISARAFSPALTSQTDESIQAATTFLACAVSDGPMGTAGAQTFTATVGGTTPAYFCVCITVNGIVPPTVGFFSSVGHPGPRVPANTLNQGGY
jgi:hypothetical protein